MAESTESKQPPKTEPPKSGLGGFGWLLTDSEQRSLLNTMAIGIILIEFAVTVFAVGSCIASAQTLADGSVSFRFPWAAYLVAVLLAPVAVMFVAHIIDLGFSRMVKGDPALDPEKMKTLPLGLQKLIALVHGAPTIILLGGVLVLGILLYYLDAVMGFVVRLGDNAEKVALWATIGLVTAWCVSYLARMWFLYKTRRMQEEYAFRREVLERTGIVITDAASVASSRPAPALEEATVQRAIDVSPTPRKRLPPGPGPEAD